MADSTTDLPTWVPAVDGLLSVHDVAATAASIAAMQEPSGAVPWTVGEHTDVWNHVEAAMALLVGGQVEASDRAFQWCLDTQRPDGSWPMKIVAGEIEDHSGETNMSAYLAVGVWHNWLVRRDEEFVRRHWPAVRAGLDWVVSLQLPFGGIAWSQEWTDGEPGAVNADALVAGSSSIYQALRAGVALSELVDEPQPEWELAGGRLGHALREHRDLFLDKSEFSMDWYYPVLGGAVRGPAALELLATRWDDFVEPGLGIRCVDRNPWVTGAETCELVLALDAAGDRERALQLLTDVQHLRTEDGKYWTGWVFPDQVNWPHEHTTYTAAAVILAVDALGHGSGGSDIMRGATLVPDFQELALECGCSSPSGASGDRVAGVSAHTS
ncbi:prenyltransferase [Nocardioides sp. KIGAM211]|uniref:Prenyltransferase n=1 Tax=Nocardioides luti TaxID=2761101 RepID=A0A7X0RFK7_9ACTN|nr:prenyltransferase [Nocardioides luti]MBB6626104.1 prenyltransferase [Nocardioides luti]